MGILRARFLSRDETPVSSRSGGRNSVSRVGGGGWGERRLPHRQSTPSIRNGVSVLSAFPNRSLGTREDGRWRIAGVTEVKETGLVV